jgi:hypothetical protein
MLTQVAESETADSHWKSLYRIGGTAALIIVALYLNQIIVLVAWGPPPSAVIGYFTLFQSNWLLGLLDLDLLSLVDYALMGLMFLALYVALRRADETVIAIATALSFVGIAAYYASNTSLSMLSLSDQYAHATTDVQRSMLLAADCCKLGSNQNIQHPT